MGASPSSTKFKDIPHSKREWTTETDEPPQLERVYGVKKQLNAYALYNPECSQCNGYGCNAGQCSAFTHWDKCEDGGAAPEFDASGVQYTPDGQDYTAFYQDCFCSTKPHCSRVNVEECWLGPSARNAQEPTWRADWTSNDRERRCTYDLRKIDTLDQVLAYRAMYDPRGERPDDPDLMKIMSKFCSRQTDQCLPDPTTGKLAPTCSLITADGERDKRVAACRYWFENLKPANQQAFMYDYCEKNKNNAECKCVLRQSDPAFIQSKQVIQAAVADACIYVPCKGGTPAFFIPVDDRKPTCPNNICQIAYNVDHVDGNVIISNNQNYLSCPWPEANKPPFVPPPVLPVPPTLDPLVDYIDAQSAALYKQKHWGIIVCGALVLLILVLVVFMRRSKPSS